MNYFTALGPGYSSQMLGIITPENIAGNSNITSLMIGHDCIKQLPHKLITVIYIVYEDISDACNMQHL